MTVGQVFGWARRTPYLAGLPRDVAVLSFVAFSVALGYGIAAPVIPVFARTFGVSAFLASWVISGFALMRLLSAAPAGLMVDRWGERRIMSLGIWIVAGSSLVTALAQDFVQLVVLRGVGGIGSAMFTVSAMALLLRTAGPEQRGRASGSFQAGFLFGGVAGPAVGGLVTGISLRAPFVVYGVTLVVAGLIATRYLSGAEGDGVAGGDGAGGDGAGGGVGGAADRGGAGTGAGGVAVGESVGGVADVGVAGAGSGGGDGFGQPVVGLPEVTAFSAVAEQASTDTVPESTPPVERPPVTPDNRPASLGRALRSAAYRAVLVVNLSIGFIVFGLRMLLVPLVVTESLELGAGLVGAAFLTATAVQAVALVPSGRRTDTVGRRNSLLVGVVAMLAAMLLLALTSNVAGLLLAMAASGFASAFMSAPAAAVVGDITRGQSGGRVVSAYQMVGDLGAILGPLVAGALADALGFSWAFGVGLGITLVALAFVLVMPETLRRPPTTNTT